MNEAGQIAKKNKTLKPVGALNRTITRRRATPPFADKISFIRSLILDSVKPGVIKKIYLFGSYAYGKPKKDSDIDLCVVIGNKYRNLNQYLKMAASLSHNDIRPVDLLVYKENEFLDTLNPKGIKNTIITEGKILYEK